MRVSEGVDLHVRACVSVVRVSVPRVCVITFNREYKLMHLIAVDSPLRIIIPTFRITQSYL